MKQDANINLATAIHHCMWYFEVLMTDLCVQCREATQITALVLYLTGPVHQTIMVYKGYLWVKLEYNISNSGLQGSGFESQSCYHFCCHVCVLKSLSTQQYKWVHVRAVLVCVIIKP